MPSLMERPILQTLQTVSDRWIECAFSADSQIYPSPLPLQTLKSWIKINPAFALQYVHPLFPDEIVGVCILLPIYKEPWVSLIQGGIREWDIVPGMLWSQKCEVAEVGLHVWHIERYPRWEAQWGGFGQHVWNDVRRLMEQQGPRVIGYSALAVTDDGVHFFRTRMGWKESPEYNGQWVVAHRDTETKETKIVEKRDWMGIEGWEIVNNCIMLVRLRGKMGRTSESRWWC